MSDEITSNYVYLAQNLTNLAEILVHLQQHRIIARTESDEIKAENTPFDKNVKLLTIIQSKDWNHIKNNFLEILRATTNVHCANRIEGRVQERGNSVGPSKATDDGLDSIIRNWSTGEPQNGKVTIPIVNYTNTKWLLWVGDRIEYHRDDIRVLEPFCVYYYNLDAYTDWIYRVRGIQSRHWARIYCQETDEYAGLFIFNNGAPCGNNIVVIYDEYVKLNNVRACEIKTGSEDSHMREIDDWMKRR